MYEEVATWKVLVRKSSSLENTRMKKEQPEKIQVLYEELAAWKVQV